MYYFSFVSNTWHFAFLVRDYYTDEQNSEKTRLNTHSVKALLPKYDIFLV